MSKIYGDTVGGGGVNLKKIPQSDWNQTDETQCDYIKNKPDLEQVASKDYVVPQMNIMDEMMFEKFGTGDKDYFFSQANWDDLRRYNRAYVQAYDDENDLRLGEDGKGLYALRVICRYGAGTVPRYPWMKKSDWAIRYRENNPQTELTDEEIIANHPPKDTDFEYMATLVERQPNGFIKVPTGFPTDKTEAQMEGYTVPKKYADSIKDIALGAVQKIDCPDKNRYAYTTYMNAKGESLIGLIKMGANPTADVNQPLIRRRVNGAVSTLKIPQADDDAASKYYVDQKYNGANKAVSYGNYSTMITALNSLSGDVYKVGQNIMIVTLDVPDLWVSAVSTSKSTYTYTSDSAFVAALKTTGSVKVGYYALSALETQKVDVTDYAKIDDLTHPTNSMWVSRANYALEAEVARYADIDNSKGTIDNRLGAVEALIGESGEIKKATNATYATYASSDTSKGTIEQRLTAMGFKQGTALYNTASGGLSHGTVSYTKYGKNVVGTVWFDATKISSSAVFKTNSINIIGTDIIEGLSPNGNTFGYGLLKIEDGGYVGVSLIKSGKNVALIIYNPTSSSTIAELPASQIRYIDINIGYQTS